MRLLHVYSGNLYGGIESILLTLTRQRAACPELESEMALCFEGRLSSELEAEGTPVHRLGEVRVSRPRSVRRARRALTALLATGRFDRVICHGAWPYAVFARTVRRADLPLSSGCMTSSPGATGPSGGRSGRRRILSSATVISPQPASRPCTRRLRWRSFTRRSTRRPRDCRRWTVAWSARSWIRPRTRSSSCRPAGWTRGKGTRYCSKHWLHCAIWPDWVCWQVGGAQRPLIPSTSIRSETSRAV